MTKRIFIAGSSWVYANTKTGYMPSLVKDLVRYSPTYARLWDGEHWSQVLSWSDKPFLQKRLRLFLRSGERISCRSDHLLTTKRGFVNASDIKIGDCLKKCVIPEADGISAPGHLTEEAAWLIGLYLAEGSRSEDTIQITLNVDELKWLPKIEKVAKHYGGYMTHNIYKVNTLCVRLYGKLLVALLEEFIGGKTAKDKHLKVICWKLPNVFLRKIIDGYFDGDAHFEKCNNRFKLGFTRNYSLERDLRLCSSRLNANISLKRDFGKGFNGTDRLPSFRGEWRWNGPSYSEDKSREEVLDIQTDQTVQFWGIELSEGSNSIALSSGVII